MIVSSWKTILFIIIFPFCSISSSNNPTSSTSFTTQPISSTINLNTPNSNSPQASNPNNQQQQRQQQPTSTRFVNRVERKTDGLDNGNLNTAEIQQYIRSSIGGEHFDETQEVFDAAVLALSKVDLIDVSKSDGGDGIITTKELRSYWKTLKKNCKVDIFMQLLSFFYWTRNCNNTMLIGIFLNHEYHIKSQSRKCYFQPIIFQKGRKMVDSK
jgi:hypothetical protein